VLGFKGYWKAVGEYLGTATNQQAEIAAAAIGLETLTQPCKVELMTDSRYVVETMNGRFRKKTNLDWWRRLENASEPHQITWEWTKGHAGHEVQEIADKAAKKIASLGRVDRELLEDAVVDIGVKEL
jgi:ribonuclease HI